MIALVIALVILLAAVAGMLALWQLAEFHVYELEQENSKLRMTNQTQAKKLEWLESDLADADGYRMVAKREEVDTNRNLLARDGTTPAVVSDADLEARGSVKIRDLYIEHPEKN